MTSRVSDRAASERFYETVLHTLGIDQTHSGEHYAVDCVAGWIYAVAVFASVNWAFERASQRAPQYEPALAD